ncbi:MAG TPA: DUF4199 domain-containing protein [Gillisia sp.]|nr:DUF4199 domain-containing protein [Gillisia sp.]
MEETTTTVTPGKIGANYGFILGIILILISVITYVTGLAYEGAQWPMYLYYVAFPVVIIFGIKAYKNQNNNYLSLSEALKVGVLTGVISGILFLIYNLIFNYIIEPDFAEQMLDIARDQMAASGNLTDEQIEMSLGWIKWMSNPLLGGAIFIAMSAFFGLIYSLIAGLVMKNKNPYEA